MKHTVLPTKELLIFQAQDRMALALLEDEKDTKDQRATSRTDAGSISKLIHSKNPIIVNADSTVKRNNVTSSLNN